MSISNDVSLPKETASSAHPLNANLHKLKKERQRRHYRLTEEDLDKVRKVLHDTPRAPQNPHSMKS